MENIKNNQLMKRDEGKPRLTLVPPTILYAIAVVREYGNNKYGDSQGWRQVETERYDDAAFRHLIKYLQDPYGTDYESGLPNLWHLACNIAFLCEQRYGTVQFDSGDPFDLKTKVPNY